MKQKTRRLYKKSRPVEKRSDIRILEETLGAKFGWCWSRHDGRWLLALLYWPKVRPTGEPGQVRTLRTRNIMAGFMSEARGRHWDRKSRYGIK